MNTPAGKAAAAKARRRWVKERPDVGTPVVFVVRLAGSKPFGWEIRKFGNFVLSRSEIGFGTQSLARTAGEKALAEMQIEGAANSPTEPVQSPVSRPVHGNL